MKPRVWPQLASSPFPHLGGRLCNWVARSLVAAGLMLAVAMALLVPFGSIARAAGTWTVTKLADTNDGICDADCSLREAIAVAASGDTVTFTAGLTGTITLTLGQLTIDKDLTIEGPGAGQLAVSGNNTSRVLQINSGKTVYLSGLTIANGSIPSNAYGSGIYNNGTLTLTNIIISGNTASNAYGGGIYNNGTVTLANTTISSNTASNSGGITNNGTLTVTNSTISGNSSYWGGGGISNSGTVTLTNSTISGNTTSNYHGGGIYNNAGTMTLSNTTISNNTAHDGGGGIWNSGTVTATNNAISDNSASYGGGIFSNGTLTVTNSTINGNTATSGTYGGGGIMNDTTITLTNSTLNGNSSNNYGGGVYNRNGTLTLTNVTISGNSAGSYGGGTYRSGGTVSVGNTLIGGNTGPLGGPDLYGSVPSRGHNLVSNGSGSTGLTNGVNGDLVGTAGSPIDPRVGPLAANAPGSTATRALLPGNPGIDAGDDVMAAAAVGSPNYGAGGLDQRSVARPQGAHSDIGAYELVPAVSITQDFGDAPYAEQSGFVAPYPTLLADNGARHTASGPRLGAAVDVEFEGQPNVNANGDDTNGAPDEEDGVTFLTVLVPGNSVSVRVNLQNAASAKLDAWMDFNRDGDWLDAGEQIFSSQVLVSGDNTLSFTVPAGASPSFTYVRFRVSTVGGLAPTGEATDGEVEDYRVTTQIVVTTMADHAVGPCTADDCTLREAIATAASSGDTIIFAPGLAGTITLSLGQLTIDKDLTIQGPGAGQNTVSGNSATRVFQINSGKTVSLSGLTIANGKVTGSNYGGGIYNNGGVLTLTNTTLSGNSAASSYGGGIYNNSGTVTLTNTTISGNSAGNYGGGIGNSGTVTLTNTTISGNTVVYDGGGIWNSGTLTVTNTTISGNSAGNNAYGGGIWNSGTLTVTNTTLSGNSAGNGGGIWNSGTLTVTNTTLSGNSTGTYGGGGISNSGTLTVTNSTISGNSSSLGSGGIYTNAGTVTVTDSTISGNSASSNYGGGIWVSNGTVTLTNTTISDNTAGNVGGGIYNQGTVTLANSKISDNTANSGYGGGITSSGTVTLTNSTISGNSAGTHGGGITSSGTLTVTNTTIAGNTAVTHGGGITSSGTLTVTNTTIAGNTAVTYGGGIYKSGGTASLGNTLIGGNTGTLGGPDVYGSVTSRGHNLVSNGSGSTGLTNGVNGDLVGTAGSPIDPRVGPLAVNAPGTTATHALLLGSPAINAGDDAIAAAAIGPSAYGAGGLDQRGVARPQGTHADIGAYEYIPTGPPFTSYTAPANGSANIYTAKLNGDNIEIWSGGVLLQSGTFDPTQPFVFNGEDNQDDTLIIDFSGGNPLPDAGFTFNSGAGGHDTMTLTGAAFGTVAHTFTNLHDGSVSMGSRTINYTGLEPIFDNLSATDRVFTFNGGAETITLSDSGTPGQTTISSTASESVTFTNPTNSLTINAGTGDDIINITGVGSGFNVSLTINGDAGTDAVNLTGALSMGSNALTINAESFTHSGTFTGGSGALTVSGSVTISGGTFTAPSGSFTVSGNWSNTGGAAVTLLSNDALLADPLPITTDGVNLYVGEGNRVLSIPVSGGAATVLYGNATPCCVLGLTRIGTDLFWIDPNGDPDATAIFRGSTSGSAITKIYSGFATGQPIVDGDGITTDGTKLYTSDEVQGRVHSLNANGSNITQLGSRYGGFFDLEHGNAITESGGVLYIADDGTKAVSPQVVSIPKTGGSFTTLHSGAPFVRPVAIAVGNGTIYVADAGANTIWTMPIAGGAPTALVSGSPFVSLGFNGLVLFNGALYVTDAAGAATGAIYRVDLGAGSTFNPGANTVTFDGAGTQTLDSGGASFNNLVHSGAGTLQLTNNALTATGAFSNSNGTFDANGKATTVTGLATVSGGTYQASTATQTFNGGLTVSGGAFTGGAGAVDVNGNLTLSSGTLTAPSGSFTVSGNWVNNGTVTHNSGTVTFNGTTTISGSVSTTFNNVTITGALTGHAANMDVAGNWVNNGTFTHNSGTVTFNGTTTISGSVATTFNNVTITGALIGHATNVNVAGNWVNNGTFTHNSGTVTFTGTTTTSGSSTTTFYNVTISGVLTGHATNVNVAGNWVNNGTFTHNGGTVTFTGTTTISGSSVTSFYHITVGIGGVLTAPVGNLNIAGNWVNNGIFNQTTGTMVFSGVTTVSGTGTISFNNVTIDNSGALTAPSGAMNVAGNWVNNGTFTHNGGTVTFTGTTTISGSVATTFNNVTISGVLTGHATNVNVAGNWVNNGTFTHNSGTVTFNGTTTISGSVATSFNNVTISGTLTGHATNVNVASNWVNNGTFTHNSGTVTFTGTTTISGSVATTFNNVTISGTLTGHATNVNVAGNWVNNGTFTHNSGTVTFTGTTTISGSVATSFNNVTISGTLTGHATNVNVAGNWVNNGTFTHNSGTVTFTGTTTISGNVTTFYHVTITGTLTGHATNVNVAGNWVNNGTFNHNSGTVTFTGATPQGLAANAATPFANLTVSAGTTLVETVAADNVTVSGTLTNNGTIRKSQSISGTGNKTFGLTGVATNVTTKGSLSNLQVDRVDSNHAKVPVAPNTGLQTGRTWTATPTGGDYLVSLTLPIAGPLPHSGANYDKAQICRYAGSGGSDPSDWACSRTSSSSLAAIPGQTVQGPTVTRSGLATPGDWVVSDPEADLSASKADSPDPVLINQTITYTPYTVRNLGPFPATSVVLTDTLPAGVSNVSASADLGGACGVVGPVVTCNWSTLANGATSTVTLTVTAPNSPQNMILNTASVSALEYDPSSANNNTTSGTTVINPAPGTGAMTFSATWWTGSLTVDANANGTTADAVDRLYYALTDTDSNGVYDRLDLSLGDDTFAQGGSLTNSSVSTSGDDERLLASGDITLGARLFTVAFAGNPGSAGVTSDLSITSKTWYKGAFTIDVDADGNANDTVSFVLVDTDSDGLYQRIDLSTDDATYGETAGETLSDGHTGANDDEESTSGSLVRLGSYYSFTVSFVNNPSGAASDASLTSKTWFTGTFTVDMNADGDLLDNEDIVAFVLGDTDSDGRYDTLDVSTDDGLLASTTFGEGTLSGQSPRQTGVGDDERLTASADVRLGANYLFTVAFDNNPGNDNDDARIAAKTHYEGSFMFDADRNGTLEGDGSNTVFFGLSDTDSNGLYDTMDLSLTSDGVVTPALSQFGEGGALTNAILKPGDDERFAFGNIPWRLQIGTATTIGNNTAFAVDASFDNNPPADVQDASILQISSGPPLVYTALNSWQIDADGDTVADDHVFFVLSATGSTGVIDTIDISIGNLTFGQNVNDSYASADGLTDARFSGACPCSKVVKLGTHYFLVEFFSDVLARTDDARISSRWYVGTFPVDVDNDRTDNTIDFVLVDPDSDGVYTVMELDGDDSGAYTADEVHRSAGARWGNPRRAAAPGDVGTHTAIAATDINTVFIAYYDADNADLKFTKTANAGLDWSTPVTIDSTGDVGQYASIAAVSANTLYVSYYDASNSDLKFAKSSDGGSTWTMVTVDSGGNVGQYSHLAAVDANTIFISYYDATNGDLKLARTTNGGAAPGDWSAITVDSASDVGRYTSISALNANRVYVSYYDVTNGNLKAARTTNGGAAPGDWTTVTVDSSANDVGQYTSIAAVYDTTPNDDANGGDTVFISYYDATNKDLKFARTPSGGDAPGEWTISTIDSADDVGQYTSLYAKEMSTVTIAYYDATPNQIRLKSITSTNGGASFDTPVIVDSGNVGKYVSLTGIQVHTLFASYYDAHERDLKFVRSVLLVDLEGHRMSIRYSFNPTVADSAVLKDGRIIRVAQLDRDHWLFTIPRSAEPGPNIEQSQVRVVVQATGEVAPGFYNATLTIQQTQ